MSNEIIPSQSNGGEVNSPVENHESRQRRRIAPRWEGRKDENGYRVRVEIPGVEKNQVRLRQERQIIVLEADRGDLTANHELLSGRPAPEGYQLRLKVPAEADPEKFSASLNKGVLEVVLPLRTENLPREIPLN